MTRFYFRIVNDIEVEDVEGEEFDNLAAARHKAVTYARDLAAEAVRQGSVNLDHCIVVENDAGESLLTLSFGDVFEIARGRTGQAS